MSNYIETNENQNDYYDDYKLYSKIIKERFDLVEEDIKVDEHCEPHYIFSVKNVVPRMDETRLKSNPAIYKMTSLGAFTFFSRNESNASLNCLDAKLSGDPENLSLAYEKLCSIPKIFMVELSPFVQILDLSSNEFENLDFLVEFRKLTTLICDHNKINSNTQFPFLPNLKILWLNHCELKELFPWIRKLSQSCPNLEFLSLMGNAAVPCYYKSSYSRRNYLEYRLFVISLFPKMVYLDEKAVLQKDHELANKSFKKSLLERMMTSAPMLPNCIRQVSTRISNIVAHVPSFAENPPNINNIV